MKRTHQAGGDDLRSQILSASLDLIQEQGLASLSMREVARRAGVSHQAPYHHFADRNVILAELARQGYVQLTEAMRAAVAQARGPGEAMLAVGRAYVHFALRQPAHFMLMFRPELCDLSASPDCAEAAASCFAYVSEVIGGAMTASGREAREEHVIVAWSTVHGLSILLAEGKLSHKFGDSVAEQMAAAERVLQTFSELYA